VAASVGNILARAAAMPKGFRSTVPVRQRKWTSDLTKARGYERWDKDSVESGLALSEQYEPPEDRQEAIRGLFREAQQQRSSRR